jgi:hypothetical protein
MLCPMPIEPVLPETARVAQAAVPRGNLYLRLAMSWRRWARMLLSGRSSPCTDNPRGHRGGCRRTCEIARREFFLTSSIFTVVSLYHWAGSP